MPSHRTFARMLLIPLLALASAACEGETVERDIAEIREGDTLRVLLTYNSTDYFVYRGQPMGFAYDLLREFAESEDLELEPVLVRDRTELFERLLAGEGDVVAARLAYRAADTIDAAFTEPLYTTRPTLVQRHGPPSAADLPEPVDTIVERGPEEPVEVRARLIRRPAELEGDTLHVVNRPDYLDRLVEIEDAVSGDIHVVEVEDVASVEPLIRRVARGEVRLTVSPENVARLSADYYDNLTVQPALGSERPVVWAVRRNAPELLEELNQWIEGEQDEVAATYQKYFVDRKGYIERVESEYLTSETGRLSEYDGLLRQAARTIGWDWRLLASQAYQESRFDPDARSWAGAMGILQLMPATAEEVGVANPDDPEENIAGAVRYLQKMEDTWRDEVADPEERLRFVLASYNAGAGHVQDAQRIAEKHGDDPRSWDDVSYWLLQLSKRQYYTDPVVKYGFVRGLEPVTYVDLILDRFRHYREFVREG